ncbi:DEAD/DEAH box helicase [Actinokineospora sp. PR83]|uniref:protein DpdJ n=1 Tax=Actinokineospora sp. PR83 TaxID=2884908 RepID=UPI0027E09F22|nr:protein DpdJ [Actinokineospora sp. PR83]MCG8917388.1 DEAD/DEAH box helicase [Actinokineospora sp. PR83]
MNLDPGGVFVGDLLNELENRELPLLSWGVTDGALSQDEVVESIETALATHPRSPGDLPGSQVLQHMLTRGLLTLIPGSNPPAYRTRMAEALRLMAHLRQLFHSAKTDADSSPWWQQGRPLVADYRLHVSNRRYPKRDIDLDSAMAELSKTPGWDAVAETTTRSQVGSRALARFQVDATSAVLTALRSGRVRGVVIGAGTGSGKTLAFYLPAITAIRQSTSGSSNRRVHTLALYPRTELLRDQLRDALVSLDAAEHGVQPKRALRVGVLYGETPQAADDLDNLRSHHTKSWRTVSRGRICPFLICPSCERGKLLWADEDRRKQIEALQCQSCPHRIAPGRLALTRQSIQRQPPDLLFTTTEMLNRTSADPNMGALLGWMGNGPDLVLLDEVHTYSGSHGAQVGLLLRRWQHASRSATTFVGLSATLRDAGAFFAELVGLPDDHVTHIEPRSEDMEEEGREYAIAVRSDPTSGVSVLSTSIQTAMLFGRVLEADDNSPSPFGSTGFLFTDDLDVTNRFYNNLRDAEGGQYRSGTAGRKPVLAGLRAADYPQHSARYAEAQSWDLVESIGHVLGKDSGATRPLTIARTTSQDTGVDSRAALIVATASLEVGFNDPRVGLVLQHKAPYDTSSFIQRRGRAGRRRGTRPITVVVLSEYGRDRLAYQAYDTLFAPIVPARGLPLGNRHVQKVQATQAMFDWVGRSFRKKFPRWDLRRVLEAPASERAAESRAPAWNWLAEHLENLLIDDELQDRLAQHLKHALKIDEASVQALLWEQPRSLLLSVVPTVQRRLESKWVSLRTDPGKEPRSYLPEFVTRALFEPLNLPEVTFTLPFATDKDEHLPIAKALREAVPGRVSLRYGYQNDDDRTWVPVPAGGATEIDPVTFAPDAGMVGSWTSWVPGEGSYRVLRPTRLVLSLPDVDVKNSSQGYPLWGSQVVPSTHGMPEVDAPQTGPWANQVLSVAFASHVAGNPLLLRRMTYGAECEVRRSNETERHRVLYRHGGEPAALGFELDVDGMRLEIAHLDVTASAVREHLLSPKWRWIAFQRAVTEHPALAEKATYFQRTWLVLGYLTSYALAGMETEQSPTELWTQLRDGSWRDDLGRVLAVLYRDDPLGVGGQSQGLSQIQQELTALSRDEVVIRVLNEAGELLHADDVDVRTVRLARRAYFDTVAAAVLDTAFRVCGNANEQDLIVDVVPGQNDESPATVWMTETGIGGTGLVERLAEVYAQDPVRFWAQVTTSLRPNEFESTDTTLSALVENLSEQPNGDVARAVEAMRTARSAHETEKALATLREAMTALDGPVTHAVVAALSVRLLRPGSSVHTDRNAAELIALWSDFESRLGVEIDVRVLAYAVGSGRVSTASGTRLQADQIFSLLWPRGSQVRNQHLMSYQPYLPYDRPPVLDRLLVAAAQCEDLPVISVVESGWEVRYAAELPKSGAVWLTCPVGERHQLGTAIRKVPALPVDRDVLRVYGTVTEAVRDAGSLQIRVELRESGR